MRHILGAALVLLTVSAAALMPPLKVNFQGRLVDPATSQPRTTPVSLTFKLYRSADPADTAFVWSETQNGVPVVNGVFTVQLGSAALLSADVLAHTSAYLGITVVGDANGEMQPRQQLVMAPYAYTSAQLAGEGAVRVNAGTSYSTFTAGGSLDLQYGLDATTGVFTASGDTVYAVQVSSGLLLSSGTLRVAAGSHGIDATGTGITASTGIFTGTGNTLPSVTTSSGIRVAGGTLDVEGNGGLLVQYGVVATTFSGNGSNLGATSGMVQVSSQTTQKTSTAELVIAYSTVTLSAATKDVLLLGRVVFVGGTTSTVQLRVRRGATANTACTTAGTLIEHNQLSVVNTANLTIPYPVMAHDSPGAIGPWSYCVTAQGSAAWIARNRALAAVEISSTSASGAFLP